MIKSIGQLYLNRNGNNRLELIWKLAQVEFRKRYYNDRLGILWALINPLFQMGIYYVIFTRVFQNSIDNFALFIFSGLLIWMSFSEATSRGMDIINAKRYLIENIQFNKIDLYLSSVLSVFMGLSFNILVYLIFSLISNQWFTWKILYFPIIYFNVFLLCVSGSLILSTLTGILKDVRHLWNLFLLAGFFGSGIFYSGEKLIESLPVLQYINPFLGIIINTRRVLFYGIQPDNFLLIYNLGFGIIVTVLAYWFYIRFLHITLERL